MKFEYKNMKLHKNEIIIIENRGLNLYIFCNFMVMVFKIDHIYVQYLDGPRARSHMVKAMAAVASMEAAKVVAPHS